MLLDPGDLQPDPQSVRPLSLSDQTIARLRGVSILSSLDEHTLHCLDGTRELHLAADQILVRQGEVSRFFWILLSGSLRMFSAGADGKSQMRYTMDTGGTFGEVPLLANIPSAMTAQATEDSLVLQLDEDQFWGLMTSCPGVRKAILGNMAARLAKMQATTFQQEKMASLGTLAAGLMHELNNPGSAARRASSQLRGNLLRMHELTARFARTELSKEQKQCMLELQEHALSAHAPVALSSLEQSDAEEALAEWMESAEIQDAWKLAPTLVSIGIGADDLACARQSFSGAFFSDALSWLEALVSSMQLVGTIEESIGRVTDLVHAVKTYAYEGRGQTQVIDINASIHATLVILAHKIREKQVTLEKSFDSSLPPFSGACHGLNQIWTNLLDNAIDAAPQSGRIVIRTWSESTPANGRRDVCVLIGDNGQGIPLECQPHIFDPFFTTKPVGVGTGLGLGIVYRIAEQCGGTVRFASNSAGTEFVVRLPAGA